MGQRLDKEILEEVAGAMTVSQMKALARGQLGLSDNDIESCIEGRETLRDCVFKGLTMWRNKSQGTMIKLIQELEWFNITNTTGAFIDVEELLGTRSEYTSLDDATLHTLSKYFTNRSWTEFLEQHLHMTQAEVEANLQRDYYNPYKSNFRILNLWFNKQHGEVNVRHLYNLMIKAQEEDGFDYTFALCILNRELTRRPFLLTGERYTIKDRPLEVTTAMREVRERLCPIYQREYKSFRPFPWEKASRPLKMNDVYREPTAQRTNKRNTAMSEHKPFPMKKIFDELPNVPNGDVILVEGSPGSGKTMFSKKMVYDWASGTLGNARLKTFELIILIIARTAKEYSSVESYIAKETLGASQHVGLVRKALSDAGHAVLFIIDGFEEIEDKHRPFFQLLKKQEYSKATLLITSRIGACSQENVRKYCDLEVTMNDLEDESILSAMKSTFITDEMKPVFTDENIGKHQLRQLAFNPLHLALICFLHREMTENKNDATLHMLCKALIGKTVTRFRKELGMNEEIVSEALSELSDIAHNRCLKNNKFFFEDEAEYKDSVALRLGLTNSYASGFKFKHHFIVEMACQYLGAKNMLTNSDLTSVMQSVPEISDECRRLSSITLYFIGSILSSENKTKELSDIATEYLLPVLKINSGTSHHDGGHAGLQFLAEAGKCLDTDVIIKFQNDSQVILSKYCVICANGFEHILKSGARVEYVDLNSEVLQSKESSELLNLCEKPIDDITVSVSLDTDKELLRCYGNDDGVLKEKENISKIVAQRIANNSTQETEIQQALTELFVMSASCQMVGIRHHPEEMIVGSLEKLTDHQRQGLQWKELHLDEAVSVERIKLLIPSTINIKPWSFGSVPGPPRAVGGVAGVIAYITAKVRELSEFR